MKRTQDEILEHIAVIHKRDFFGFETADLVVYLDYEHARSFIKSDVTELQWNAERSKRPVDLFDEVRRYMDFAWSKVRDHRGISTSRSISHMAAWLWLAGDDEFADVSDDNNYACYGAPILARICRKYEVSIPDDLVHMATPGTPCVADCDQGCLS